MTSPHDPLGFLVVDVARLFRHRFETALADAGLGITPGEARTLHQLGKYGPLRQTVLAARLSVEPMTLVGYVDRLERAGLVLRQPDPDDRRAKNVVPTPAAETLIPRIRAIALSVRSTATAGLDPAAIESLRSTLTAMRRNLDPGSGAETPA